MNPLWTTDTAALHSFLLLPSLLLFLKDSVSSQGWVSNGTFQNEIWDSADAATIHAVAMEIGTLAESRVQIYTHDGLCSAY